MLPKKDIILVLFSGGIDSTALINFYVNKNNRVKCLHFQYGQASAESEYKSVKEICKYYDIHYTLIKLEFNLQKRFDEYIGRNALFALIALSSSASEGINRIAIGINASSEYYDCSKDFVSHIQAIIDGYYLGTRVIEAPFLNLTKYEIIQYCISNDVPLDLTYSCLRQNFPPCGECGACKDRSMISEIDKFKRAL